MPDTEETRLLRETLAVEKENNRLLRKMNRDALIGRILTIVFWGITLGVPLVLYYFFVAPYLHSIQQSYQGIQDSAKQMQSVEAKLPPWAREMYEKMFGSPGSSTTPK